MRAILWIAIASSACTHSSGLNVPPPGPLAGSATAANCTPGPIYAVIDQPTNESTLLAFDPTTAAFSTLGVIDCSKASPAAFETVNSTLAVDRNGFVYVAYGTCGMEWMFRIDPATLACSPTPFYRPRTRDQVPNGMGCVDTTAFAQDPSSATGETLYFLDDGLEIPRTQNGTSFTLWSVDPSTSTEHAIANLAGPSTAALTNRIPLAGTPTGLFADYQPYPNFTIGTDLGPVDTATGSLTFMWQNTEYPETDEGDTYRHFAFSRGAFYLFTYSRQRPGGEVVRFSLSDFSVTKVADNPGVIAVAASTCDF